MAVAAFALSAEPNGQGAQRTASTSAESAITFTANVAPILFGHCALCHRPDGPAPFSLLSYGDARRHATQIATVTANRSMPPWMPESSGAFVGERRLIEREIAT